MDGRGAKERKVCSKFPRKSIPLLSGSPHCNGAMAPVFDVIVRDVAS